MLDDDAGSPEEVQGALRSLVFVNRWFGGDRVHRRLLLDAAQGRSELSVLEVAAGRATTLAAAALSLKRRAIAVHPLLLDRQASHLPPAWPASLPPPKLLAGDALAIPLPDASVDVVSCCLFLHHLAPEEVAAFLREALRVARVAVLINDLERTRLHYALAWLFSLVDPSRLSSHDGPVSVRQAYSLKELRAALEATGRRFTLRRAYLCRLAALLWVR